MAGEGAGFGNGFFAFQIQQAVIYLSGVGLKHLLFNVYSIACSLFLRKGGMGCCPSHNTVM
jgi:hypothetical protein